MNSVQSYKVQTFNTGKHPSHEVRVSVDSSSYDYVCVKCGAKDISGGGWGLLQFPCASVKEEENNA